MFVGYDHPLVSSVLGNTSLSQIGTNWDQLGLNDCWLLAGSVVQTVWNLKFGLPPEHGISDIDLVYFDAQDLSFEVEQENQARIQSMFAEVDCWIDVKNEARVHLWYREKLGFEIQPYTSTKEAITTFPTTATAIGTRPTTGEPEIYCPFGSKDLLEGVVRPNNTQITREIYERKVSKWIHQWPQLQVIEWDDR